MRVRSLQSPFFVSKRVELTHPGSAVFVGANFLSIYQSCFLARFSETMQKKRPGVSSEREHGRDPAKTAQRGVLGS